VPRAFDQPALTRKERANNVRKRNYFTKYGPAARDTLEALLQKYADEGVDDIETMNVLKLNPLSRLGTPVEIVETSAARTSTSRLSAILRTSCTRLLDVGPGLTGDLSHVPQYDHQDDPGHHAQGCRVDGDAQRVSQLGWMLFLKVLDDRDAEKELLDDDYKSPSRSACAGGPGQ